MGPGYTLAGMLAVHVSHQAIGCSQIDSDEFCHNENPQELKPLR